MFENSSDFYGRSLEFDTPCDWLSQGEHVAVVGPPGIGKTRLCFEVIKSLTEGLSLDTLVSGSRFPVRLDGLHFALHYVDLAEDPEFLHPRRDFWRDIRNDIYLVESREAVRSIEWGYAVSLGPMTAESVAEELRSRLSLSGHDLQRAQAVLQGHPLAIELFADLLNDPGAPPADLLLKEFEK